MNRLQSRPKTFSDSLLNAARKPAVPGLLRKGSIQILATQTRVDVIMRRGSKLRRAFQEPLLHQTVDDSALLRDLVHEPVSLPINSRSLTYPRCAFCLTAPGLDEVARATSSTVIPETFSMISTSR